MRGKQREGPGARREWGTREGGWKQGGGERGEIKMVGGEGTWRGG